MAKRGEKVIAVSRDLRKYFPYGEKVLVESNNPSIQGCYKVEDTMNARFTKRIDLFFLTRKENQGGNAVISNKIENCN